VNHQNLQQFVTVQYNHDLLPSKVNASNIIFPTPSWERRDCEVSGLCKTRGGCLDNGDCVFANCKAGQYLKNASDGSGGQSCVDCPAGFISTSGIVTQCTACMPGEHTPWHLPRHSRSCDVCKRGSPATFANEQAWATSKSIGA
jgi:hypothetical protein